MRTPFQTAPVLNSKSFQVGVLNYSGLNRYASTENLRRPEWRPQWALIRYILSPIPVNCRGIGVRYIGLNYYGDVPGPTPASSVADISALPRGILPEGIWGGCKERDCNGNEAQMPTIQFFPHGISDAPEPDEMEMLCSTLFEHISLDRFMTFPYTSGE